jgi:hypothetical protein
VVFYHLTWRIPALEGRVTQSQIELRIGKERAEAIRLNVLFYLNVVRADGETVTETELREILSIAKKNVSLKYVEIFDSPLPPDLINKLQNDFGIQLLTSRSRSR